MVLVSYVADFADGSRLGLELYGRYGIGIVLGSK